jgi:peptide/nickel transport system permease protein
MTQRAGAAPGDVAVPSVPRSRSRLSSVLRWLGRAIVTQPLGAAGAVIVLIFILCALVPGLFAPYDPNTPAVGPRLADPGADYLMGTDSIGRDVFSRIIYGARLSVLIGFGSVAIGTVLGTLIGIVTGYYGGLFDTIVQRLIDALMTVPGLIVALVVVTVWGQGVTELIFAISILIVPGAARIVRSSALAEKNNQYIEAARVLGATQPRILFRHLLPNITAPIIVIVSVMVGVAILVEAALAFLGLGVPPPTASWGQMLSIDGRTYMLQQPWLAVWPGLAITFVVLGLNLLGDALRDMLDPKMRGR